MPENPRQEVHGLQDLRYGSSPFMVETGRKARSERCQHAPCSVKESLTGTWEGRSALQSLHCPLPLCSVVVIEDTSARSVLKDTTAHAPLCGALRDLHCPLPLCSMVAGLPPPTATLQCCRVLKDGIHTSYDTFSCSCHT